MLQNDKNSWEIIQYMIPTMNFFDWCEEKKISLHQLMFSDDKNSWEIIQYMIPTMNFFDWCEEKKISLHQLMFSGDKKNYVTFYLNYIYVQLKT